ncbi:hypothetical protein GCM10010446_00010 [Streptomyces enissocaesilis]|uniref:Uncharacterized protein n=1 Tax=Streptomyces enissocaesilis TaxID=332589 RepID=A0ABN3WMS7_9ACTN
MLLAHAPTPSPPSPLPGRICPGFRSPRLSRDLTVPRGHPGASAVSASSLSGGQRYVTTRR